MRSQVIVVFGPGQEYTCMAAAPASTADDARRWLDEQFIANECEPLRSTGKVLTADKVMALAATVGAPRFAADADWAAEFARATVAALGRPLVRVDVGIGAISY